MNTESNVTPGATFKRPDFLCIVPFAWGRAQTAREAYRIARDNMPGAPYVTDKAKAPAMIWRFSDAVDEVEVSDLGGFSYRPADGRDKTECEARLVWKGNAKAKPGDIAELPLEAIPD